MDSKTKLFYSMQRVMNDMLIHDESIKPIAFIEVAKLLAEIGQEQVEPELLETTSSYSDMTMGKAMFQAIHHESQILISTRHYNHEPKISLIKNTKESLFHALLGYLYFFSNQPKEAA
ncbi:hypothetical protein [Serratia marcescens]|uniref:hypothetical protein n=1 Tax=Serratia marcescens TaxID=615 RepID=UPI001F14CDB9|nr:hypothetical protein [Serratia marcescens]